jgi:sarcosine oxidase, subunit beta
MYAVIVIGAGILGVTTAFHLARLGVKGVHVIDREGPGAGATGRSGALVRANYDNEAEALLALKALDVWHNFDICVGGDAGFKQTGHIVTVSAEKAQAARELAEQQRTWGVDICEIAYEDALELAPLLRRESNEVFLYHADAGYCDPSLALASYVCAAEALGVTFENGTQITGIAKTNGVMCGVCTQGGILRAETVVIATGARTNALLPPELNLDLVPRLSRVAVFHPFEFAQQSKNNVYPSLIDQVQKAWFRPMPGHRILVGCDDGGITGHDPNTLSESVPEDVINLYRDVLTHRFNIARYAPLNGAWAGTFMLSPDHKPLVGSVPGTKNLWLIGGDSGGAFKTAPALGLGLAELIVFGQKASVEIDFLSPLRLTQMKSSNSLFSTL